MDLEHRRAIRSSSFTSFIAEAIKIFMLLLPFSNDLCAGKSSVFPRGTSSLSLKTSRGEEVGLLALTVLLQSIHSSKGLLAHMHSNTNITLSSDI